MFNESPQITSEIRPFYMYNRIPGHFLTGGGTIQLFAVQARLALTDRLGLIATKDGYANLHFDHECLAGVFGVIEANVVSTISDGSRTAVNFEGFDLVNFGSTNSGTVATIGLGSRVRLSEQLQLGVAWEFPVTGREDIIGDRLTVDGIFQF